MEHPHPNKAHVVYTMRAYLMGAKRKFGTTKGLGKRLAIIQTYLTAKRRAQ